MIARDLMTWYPTAVTPETAIVAAAGLMREMDVGALPLIDERGERRVVGIITDRDIVTRCVADRHTAGCTVGDHMTAGIIRTVSEDESSSRVLSVMERYQVRRVPVLNQGRLVGIIAQADIATKMGPQKPHIVEEVVEAMSRPVPTFSAEPR